MDALKAWSDSELEGTAKRHDFPRFGIHLFLVSFVCVYYLCNAPLMLAHYDLGWHLAAGDLIREQRHVPLSDPWSFTHGDKPWYNLSWLWDVIAATIFQFTGFGGLVLGVVAFGAVIVFCLANACLDRGASATAASIAVFAAGLLYPSFETAPNIYLAAAPNTVTMLFCVIFYAECLRRTRCYLLPAIMLLWVNLHGGFLLGFAIVGVFCGAALLRRDWASVRSYGFAAVGCAIAIFINPYGWHVYDGVTATLGHFVQAHITEWWPYYRNMAVPGSIPAIVYMLAFMALELRYASDPVPLESRLLSWLFLCLGLYQFRYMSFFFIFSTVPMALHLERLLPRLNNSAVQNALLAAGVIGAVALPLTFMRAAPALALPPMLSEQDALYLRSHFSQARVLNHWNVGGILIFRTHGSVPLFVDGRAATAYPDDLLRDYFTLIHDEIDETAWDTVLDKYRVDAVLWVKAHEELRRFLVDKRGWKETYAGQYMTIYARP